MTMELDKSTDYLIHTPGALPLSGPRGVVELTAATPTDNMTCGDTPAVFHPAAKFSTVGKVRSTDFRPLVTAPSVPSPLGLPAGPLSIPTQARRPAPVCVARPEATWQPNP